MGCCKEMCHYGPGCCCRCAAADKTHCCRCGWYGYQWETVGDATHNCPKCGSTWEVTEGDGWECNQGGCAVVKNERHAQDWLRGGE